METETEEPSISGATRVERDIAARIEKAEQLVRTRLAIALRSRKPEGDFNEHGTWIPSARENIEGTRYERDRPLADPLMYRRNSWWTSTKHTLALIEAFFAGREVPFDIADVCRNRAEMYREQAMRQAVDSAVREENERREQKRKADVEREVSEQEERQRLYEESPAGKLQAAIAHKKELQAKLEKARREFEAYEKGIQTRISRVNRSIGALKARLK